jgi:hypothetical protein
MAAEAPILIRRVRRDGQVDLLGEWRPASKDLVLSRPGFPLTPPGTQRIEGDLPWVFDELAPDGFLAARFGRWFPELHLPKDRSQWTANNVVQAISERGHDLAGNLLIGETSRERYLAIFAGGSQPGPTISEAPNHYPAFVDEVLRARVQSSVGGARPKFALRLADGNGIIVKFTPPLSTPAGARWADLLRVEAHASETLRAEGISAVKSRYLEMEDRGFLEIERFDRFAGGGRGGHVTLYHLGVSLYGEMSDPVPVVAALLREGYIGEADAKYFERIHSFSRAIANDDTHLGNYGLLIDDEGKARLAPAYDVVPMAFAPRHDELPDRLVQHTGRRDADTDRLVERLIAKVRADPHISAAFRERWLRAVR